MAGRPSGPNSTPDAGTRLSRMPGNPLTDPTWATQFADLVEKWVGVVRDTATRRVVTVVRALVFGSILATTAIVLGVVSIIFVTKLLQRIVNIGGWIDTDSSVWVSYLVAAALFAALGATLMRLRERPDDI